MFERICINPNDELDGKFELGLIAESLLFYGEVHVVINEAILKTLLQQIEPELLLHLVSERYLHLHFNGKALGAITAGRGTSSPLYDVGFIELVGINAHEAITNAFVAVVGKAGRGRRMANKLVGSVSPIAYPSDATKTITADMQNGVYLEAYLRRALNEAGDLAACELLEQLVYRFEAVPGKGFKLRTNLSQLVLKNTSLHAGKYQDPASVLAAYGATIVDIAIWSQLGTEASVSRRQEDVLTTRLEIMLNQRRKSQDQLCAFQEFAFDDARAVREIVNRSPAEFKNLLPVLKKSRKFHEWLAGKPASVDLVKEYHREVMADSWLDKLPTKVTRWSLFTAGGIVLDAVATGGIATIAGVAIGALDTFLLDRLAKGWCPNQFVQGPLRDFVSRQSI